MRLCDLKRKEVINICTCRTGTVLALIVPGPGKLCWFLGRDTEYVIPWECISQIGADIILIKIDEETCRKSCL